MIGEGYFFGSAKSFHAQMKMINYISDVISDAPLSSLHGEVMLPMLTSYSSQPASIPHVLVLTGQLLLVSSNVHFVHFVHFVHSVHSVQSVQPVQSFDQFSGSRCSSHD